MNSKISKFIERAKADEPVFISDVYDAFDGLETDECFCIDLLLKHIDGEKTSKYSFQAPSFTAEKNEENDFIHSYLYAHIYNILSAMGGCEMQVVFNTENSALKDFAETLNDIFMIESPRNKREGFGRCINVNDRILHAVGNDQKFSFKIVDKHNVNAAPDQFGLEMTTKGRGIIDSVKNMDSKLFLGLDIGGTQIKCAISYDDHILGLKTYDWFPAGFTRADQMIDPICCLTEIAAYFADFKISGTEDSGLASKIREAMSNDADLKTMQKLLEEIKTDASLKPAEFDGIGVSFPDVVIKNKITGGEVYKCRGMRHNPDIDYEEDFKKITDLDLKLKKFLKENGVIRITNDGHIAAFTAAVEKIYSAGDSSSLKESFFAHTLGTELGSGLVDTDGHIPDIPFEIYNFIIDLGSWKSREYHCDDLRSTLNFNTGLAGTLQKYTSQSGVFRLVMKYFPDKRPELYNDYRKKGYIEFTEKEGKKFCGVQVEPKDMRKSFLSDVLSLPDLENDDTVNRIFREIGECLAVMLIESERILGSISSKRILFGGLVARHKCFRLMMEGVQKRKQNIQLEVADNELCCTPLMQELAESEKHSPAHFAQAIGSIYFANKEIATPLRGSQ